jgi:hypothetical protein
MKIGSDRLDDVGNMQRKILEGGRIYKSNDLTIMQ